MSGAAQAGRAVRAAVSSAAALAFLAATVPAALPVQAAAGPNPATATTRATQAQRGSPALSQDAREVLAWIRASGNNAGLPFVLIDKRSAAAHVFDAQGAWQASAPVLLGLARGDHSVPGIGERPMAQIARHERTTPAGRFVSEPGVNMAGEDIVWVHYDDAISLHRVRPTNPAERRLQRLASPGIADNRISYGCINAPASFYDRFIAPTLGRHDGVVYVLPETQPVAEFFGFKAGGAGASARPD
ncbi:hypothetical protein GCM10027019_22220 [Melaminivora jejuensis]